MYVVKCEHFYIDILFKGFYRNDLVYYYIYIPEDLGGKTKESGLRWWIDGRILKQNQLVREYESISVRMVGKKMERSTRKQI